MASFLCLITTEKSIDKIMCLPVYPLAVSRLIGAIVGLGLIRTKTKEGKRELRRRWLSEKGVA